jgi:hypothetical protein
MDLILFAVLIGLILIAGAVWLLLHPQKTKKDALAKVTQTPDLTVPEAFDGRIILAELVSLADKPDVVDQFFYLLRNRFEKSGKIDLLNQWERMYKSAKNTIEAKTALLRAQREYIQLGEEDKIKNKETEVRLARLDADKAEQRLRKEQAKKALEELNNPSPKKSPYRKQMDSAWAKEKETLLWKLRNRSGKHLASLQALNEWYHEELEAMNHNTEYLPTQRTELIQELNKLYEEEKEHRKRVQSSQTTEAGPEEEIYTN